MKKISAGSTLLLSLLVSNVMAMDAPSQSSTTTHTSDTAQTTTTTQEPAPVQKNTTESTLHKIGTSVSDAAITTAISAKYAVDPLLGPFSIDVSTSNGQVILSGVVDSKTQYERALHIASETKGATSVDAKNLQVTPSEHYSSDAYTTARVKSALLKAQYFNNASFNAWNVRVETNNGTVFLTGRVPDNMAKNQVMEIVRQLDGVNKIEADLQTTL